MDDFPLVKLAKREVHKMRRKKKLYKMRKNEKITFQWPRVSMSRLLATIPHHRPDFRTGFQIFVSGTGSDFSEVRKCSESGFFSLSK